MSDLPTGPLPEPEDDGVESDKAKNFDATTHGAAADLSEYAPQQHLHETPAPQRDVQHY